MLANQTLPSGLAWQPIELMDDYRASDADKKGGFPLKDPEIIKKYRTAMHDLMY